MKILLVQTNTFVQLMPLPIGPAMVAARLREEGHEVRFCDLMAEKHPVETAARMAREFVPDLVCFSIRNRDNQLMLAYNDPMPGIRDTVTAVRGVTSAPLLLGGTAFTTFPERMLEYLDADYGIAGDDLDNVARFIGSLGREQADLQTPGLVYRRHPDGIIRNPYAISGYASFSKSYADFIDRKRYRRAYWDAAVITRSGCPEQCIYCDTYLTYGSSFILRDPAVVAEELLSLKRSSRVRSAYLVDAGFNRPLDHAKEILREIIKRGAQLRYYAVFDPGPADDEFFALYRRAGGSALTVFAESLSDPVLEELRKSFTYSDVLRDTTAMRRHGIGFMLMPVLGAPGETPRTIQETLDVIDAYAVPLGVWTTIGICLWTPLQKVLVDARRDGQLADGDALFDGINYLSPRLERPYMEDLISSLRARAGFSVQVNQPYPGFRW